MRRPKIGDIVEIRTKRGLAYAQFTHNHEKFGSLLRVLEGFYQEAPRDLNAVANSRSRFQTFFPLGAAVHRGIVSILGNAAIPDEAKAFPTFRSGSRDLGTMTIKNWWLWDGEKEWMVGDLTPDQWKYPLRSVWNDTLLVKRIEEDWNQDQSSG
ncbi:MAG TPA: hypothetical protein VGK19_20020 [Capsulimonadaceae bacterium]